MLLSFGVLTVLSFFLVRALTGRIRSFLIARSVMDIPNERSAHTAPVPRGGGWALLAVIVPLLLISAWKVNCLWQYSGLIAGLLVLAAVSWIDDKRNLSPSIRLAVHLFAALLGSTAFPSGELLFGDALPFWADRAILILGWAWFMNLYNFMDGIDGITGVETVSIALGFCALVLAFGIHHAFGWSVASVLIGSSLGFLVHNWHPAKIFLGDVGSIPLGFLTGYCLLVLALRNHMAAAFILPLYYLADSGITLIRRALRKEKIWQSHCEHFYQKAALGIKDHGKIAALIASANAALILAAFLSIFLPPAGLVAGILIVAFLLRTLHKAASRTASQT